MVLKNFPFNLTEGQKHVLEELKSDILSDKRMFRLLQGDVGSGKTILSFIAASYILDENYQVAFMSPTEILAKQHYVLAKKLFSSTNLNIKILTSSTTYKDKKNINEELSTNKIDMFLVHTHYFKKKLNLIIWV